MKTKHTPLFSALSYLTATVALLGASLLPATAEDSAQRFMLQNGVHSNLNLNLDSSEPVPSVTLPAIVVTATRTPTLVNETLVQTQIIDSEDLKRFDGQTALEVIQNQLGFSMKQDGGMGQSSNFYVRGFDSKRVLVLVDGIRYGSMSSGQPALNLLPADQIDRIEVMYGAMGSSMYGSDAMGGVIQVFTKGSDALVQNAGSNVSAAVGYGSHNHHHYGITGQLISNVFATKKPAVLSVSASHNQTDGISSLARQTGNNGDDDGYESDNYALLVNVPLTDTIHVGATGLYAQSTTEFDDYGNSPNAHIDQKNGAVSVFADYQSPSYQTPFGVKLTAGRSLDSLDNSVGDEFTTKQTQVNVVGNYALPSLSLFGQADSTVVGGIEWLKQAVDVEQDLQAQNNANYAFAKDERTINSAFLGYQLAGNVVDLQLNARFDDNSQYDSQTTYGIGLAGHVTDTFRVGANYSTGFRAPTLNDLYVQSPYYVPNPDLEVETSKNAEVFVAYDGDVSQTRITGYQSDVKDLISNQYDPTTFKYQARNLDEARIKGVSITSDWQINEVQFGLAYDRTDATDESEPNKGKQLVYRPKHTGLLYIGYDNVLQSRVGQGMSVRAEVQHVGERYNSYDNATKLPDYQLVNVSANYELSPNLSLTTRINNLLNEDYSTNETFGQYGTRYNTDGTNYMVSLTYKT